MPKRAANDPYADSDSDDEAVLEGMPQLSRQLASSVKRVCRDKHVVTVKATGTLSAYAVETMALESKQATNAGKQDELMLEMHSAITAALTVRTHEVCMEPGNICEGKLLIDVRECIDTGTELARVMAAANMVNRDRFGRLLSNTQHQEAKSSEELRRVKNHNATLVADNALAVRVVKEIAKELGASQRQVTAKLDNTREYLRKIRELTSELDATQTMLLQSKADNDNTKELLLQSKADNDTTNADKELLRQAVSHCAKNHYGIKS